jgi:hypothetical protein
MSSSEVKIEVQNTEEDEFVDVCSHADENSRMSMATTASSGCGSSLPSTEPADESSQSGKKFENFYPKIFSKKINFCNFSKKLILILKIYSNRPQPPHPIQLTTKSFYRQPIFWYQLKGCLQKFPEFEP